MSRVGLVDLDGMIYACAAIAETVYYTVDDVPFDYKREANEYCEQSGRPTSDIERKVRAQPVSHAINALRMTVEAALEHAGCDVGELYLSPKGQNSFRFKLYPDYKANRKALVKPTHYQALRDYAVKHMGAVVADDVEADDMLTIRANELGLGKWVFITNDKDLMQTPGLHYNWSKKTTTEVTRDEAMRCLYMQVLTGDSIDNIKGCPGIGPQKAAAALRDAADDVEMLEVCKWLYTQAYQGDEEYAMNDLKLNIQLVRMLQRRPT